MFGGWIEFVDFLIGWLLSCGRVVDVMWIIWCLYCERNGFCEWGNWGRLLSLCFGKSEKVGLIIICFNVYY